MRTQLRTGMLSALLGLGTALLAGEVAAAKPKAAGKGEAVKPIDKTKWGESDGKQVDLYTLTNKNGLVAKITNYGAIVVEMDVPDKKGKMGDVVVGYDNLADFVKKNPYFGATVGRIGNRIANATFELEGKTYKLAANNGTNHLHGGLKG